jgi:hypothetical protein
MISRVFDKKKIKSYLKEITDETIHLYLMDKDVNAQIAGNGYYRMRLDQLTRALRDRKKRVVERMFETVVGVSIKPRILDGRKRFEVTRYDIAEALKERWGVDFIPEEISLVIEENGRIKRDAIWLYSSRDLVDRYVSDYEVSLFAKGKWDLLYHKVEMDLGEGFVVDFRFFIVEDDSTMKESEKNYMFGWE